MLPLFLFTMGVSGPWIGNLVQLAPYQPYFIVITIACLSCGYWLVYRSSRRECTEACGGQDGNRFVKRALVLATVLVMAAIGFNFFIPFLNS
jgi:mercuric ion transport protein